MSIEIEAIVNKPNRDHLNMNRSTCETKERKLSITFEEFDACCCCCCCWELAVDGHR